MTDFQFTKQIIDKYGDWMITSIADKIDSIGGMIKGQKFITYLLQAASKIQREINKQLIGQTDPNAPLVDNVYREDPVDFYNVVNTCYLKGGICADFLALGIDAIKPSDLDYSMYVTKPVFNRINTNDNKCIDRLLSKIQDALQWMLMFQPTNPDKFFEFLEIESAFDLVNSYSGVISPISDKNVLLGLAQSDLDYTKSILRDNLLLLRFYWKAQIGKTTKYLKINIVDISIHYVEDNNTPVVYAPLLNVYSFGNSRIITEEKQAMLLDQLLVYCSCIIRDDKKLIKRKTRVVNLISTMDRNAFCSKIKLPSIEEALIELRNDESKVRSVLDSVLESSEIYPYTLISYILAILKLDYPRLPIDPTTYKRQLFELEVEFLGTIKETTEAIQEKALENLKKSGEDLYSVFAALKQILGPSKTNIELKAGLKNDSPKMKEPSLDEIINFMIDPPAEIYSMITPRQAESWRKYKNMSRLMVGLHAADVHYKIYKEWYQRVRDFKESN